MRSRAIVIIAGLLELALLLAACGAHVAERAAQSAVDVAGEKAKASAAAAGVTVTPLPAAKDADDAQAQAAYWRSQADQARQEAQLNRQKAKEADARADAADAQAKLADARAEQLRIAAWQSRLAWIAGVMLLGILGGVALEFILPAGMRGWATTGIMICIAIAVVAMALRIVLPWLVVLAQVVAWILAIAVVAGLLYVLAKAIQAIAHASQHGDRMEAMAKSLTDWIDPDVLEHLISKVKAESAAAQSSSGVRNLIDLVRGRPKDRPAPIVRPMPGPADASGASSPATPAPKA